MGAGCSSGNQQYANKKAPAVPGLKIAIVGDCEVGKTSVYLRYLHNQFCPLYVPTKKVNIDNVVQKINQPSHALVSLTLWDIPGREDIDLHSTYFKDMDGLIVVADLTDESSIRMAPVWKQLALNSATVTGEEDRLPGTLQLPVLLLGNKLDVIEEQLLADLAAAEKEVTEDDADDATQTKKSKKPKLQKPSCVQLLEQVAASTYFTGSAVVSAKSGDGTVSQAIKAFIRHIMEKRDKMERRWQPKFIEEKDKKSRDRQTVSLDTVGIPEFDELLSQGQFLMTRVASLGAHFKETLRHFQRMCVTAKIVEEDDNSLENCLIGLKETLASENILLKLVVEDDFCHLEAKSKEDKEIEKNIRYALKAFNKEFAAVCQASLRELPTVVTSLNTLDARLETLCKEYQVPPPPPPGSHSQGGDNTDNDNNNAVDLKTASKTVEKNRGKLTHSKHQAQDLVTSMEGALKKARTAFVW
ncbi:uncharacterized protein [Littorina saxatilis]|uniref:uncharacterized protein n=1 Tax=Littorina saxatilis TaxID=31220 RepID=UPI0038B5D9A1